MKYFLYFLSILLLVVAFVDFHACAENHVLSRTVWIAKADIFMWFRTDSGMCAQKNSVGKEEVAKLVDGIYRYKTALILSSLK